jgi:hypothetical protein
MNIPKKTLTGLSLFIFLSSVASGQLLTGDYRAAKGRRYTRGDDYSPGVDGMLGLEYKIPPIPFAVSIDIKPLMEVYRDGDLFFGLDPGIGVKFTF